MLKSSGTEALKPIVAPILRKYGVHRASLFGSAVRGEQTEGSDVDFLVELERGKTLLDLIGLKLELEEILHMAVDVLTYNSIHPLLRDQIMKEQVCFYEE